MANELGTSNRALRVAIVGSGPSGFYAAEALFKSELKVEVGMFERLPSPFGLVRYGVAPDHAKIKNVTKVYERTAERDGFFFFGNVEIGKDLTIHQLRKFYDAVIFATGAETDRKLGIDGEDLPGSHPSTEFVAWYNGHPNFANHKFDLSCKTAVIIGQGNVAIDVCRILCKTYDELKKTDIAQHAIEALAESQIKEVHMVGRRGPVQAAFTPVEMKEFGELEDCSPVINPKDLEIGYASQLELSDPKNVIRKKNYDVLKDLLGKRDDSKSKKFFVHFCKSPAAIGGKNRVEKIFLEHNILVGEPGQQKSMGTGEKETIPTGLVFRSVGYRGVPIKGLPFHDQWGVIPNIQGRVMDSEHIFPGLYAAGWIKRGPSGVIGTNKACSDETVAHLIADIKNLNPCKNPRTDAIIQLMNELNIRFVTFDDWKRIDRAEIERGEKIGKPREKFVNVNDMIKAKFSKA